MKLFTCEQARAAVSDLVAGELPMADGRPLEAHLAGCAECLKSAEVFFWQDRVLAELMAGDRLDATLGRIRAGIAGVSPKEVTERLPAVRLIPRRRWKPAAAAAVIVGAVLGAMLLGRPSAPGPVAAQPPKPAPARPVPADPVNENPVVHDTPENVPPPDPQRTPEPAVPPRPPAPAPSPAVAKSPEPAPPRPVPEPEPPKPDPAAAVKVRPVIPPNEIEVLNTPARAVTSGVAYLRQRLARGLSKEARADELILWTLLHAGVPEPDPDVQRLLKSMLERKLERTYNVALQAMVLEELDRVRYQGRIAQCAQFLADNQCKNGQWSYGDPSVFVDEVVVATGKAGAAAPKATKSVKDFSEPRGKPEVRTFIKIKKLRPGPEGGDNSNTMYAALGLRACADAGIEFEPRFLQLGYDWWRRSQVRDAKTPAYGGEGWCYGGSDHGHKGYGSMTAGGVGSLVIYNYLLGRDWTKDPNVKNGLDWLTKNFSVTENPGPPEHGGGRPGFALYYYLYALERAGILYGTEKFGPHEWYPKGVDMLLENQATHGAWASKDGGNDVHDTCFAILFLRRAVPALPPPVATGVKK
jgi:hypothetical protein